METPGEYLSRERELRGVTVEDMADALKMSVKLIAALEHDDHETLPHPAYVKGFVRSYAVYLGIDDDDAVLRYESYQSDRRVEAAKVKKFTAEISPRYEAAPVMSSMASSSGRKGDTAFAALFGRGRRGNNRTIVALVGAGILIVVLYFIFSGGTFNESQQASVEKPTPAVAVAKTEKTSPSEQKVAEKPKDTVVEAVKPTKPVLKSNKKAAKKPVVKAVAPDDSALAEKGLVLEVIASDTTWISAEIDGREQREALLQPGETVRWKGAKVFF